MTFTILTLLPSSIPSAPQAATILCNFVTPVFNFPIGFRVIHWNCKGLKDKLAVTLPHFLNADVVCIQEFLLKNYTHLS